MEIIPISALNQYLYCPRRCYLMHVEGMFTDNVHTISGTYEHERVDRALHEIKQGIRVEFALPVWSDRLGLSGRCDVVEFHPDGTIYPVEYKHGKRKKWINDDVQLAAQAICLQEMKHVEVTCGSIFHIQSKRRREVPLTTALVKLVTETTGKIRTLISEQRLPTPTDQVPRCSGCSMTNVCAPDLPRASRTIKRLRKELFRFTEES